MKKSILLLCCLCLAVPGQYAFGQKTPKPSKALRVVLCPSKGPVAQATQGLTDKQLKKLILKLQRENAAAERALAAQKAAQEKAYSAARKAVFRALGPNVEATTLSGTLFKINYNGQDEIFGVIPMHVLRDIAMEQGMLSYKFTAGVFTDTTVKFIPAWVVQLSSSKTGDLALVKFRKQDEALLSPLALSTQAPQFPQQVYAQGFARNLLSRQAFQLIGTTSNGILTAQLPAAYHGDRAGFCGSPVVGEDQQLCGIHVGSEYIENLPDEDRFFSAFHLNRPALEKGDIGYVSPVSFLQQLVAAYHNPRLKPFSVTLAGHSVAQLAANEYVSRIELLNSNQQVIWTKEMGYKVSFSAAETVLRLRADEIAFIRLEIGRSHWQKYDKSWYVANTPAVRSVLYPLSK